MADDGLNPAVFSLLDDHYKAFRMGEPYAEETCHPVPCDTRAWSQILVTLLTGIPGLRRRKGADLIDGSDVKAANYWTAIDTPRFNGSVPAGRKSKKSMKAENVSALDNVPYIFFVLWDRDEAPPKKKRKKKDHEDVCPVVPSSSLPGRLRCRVWCVSTQVDEHYRAMCATWYEKKAKGIIRSPNFQLHPPKYRPDNVFKNECGILKYPLLFSAVQNNEKFEQAFYDPSVLKTGLCEPV